MDPNAVNSGGKDRENKKRALMKLLQKPKADEQGWKNKVTTKNESK